MQLITFLSAAAAVATVSADATVRTAVTLNKECDTSKPYARVINRCNYPVNLWSVFKGDGCPTDQMVTLQTGEIYTENYAVATNNTDQGVSIKISKTQECKQNHITQLEYFLDNRESTAPDFRLNYLDVSYVDCQSDECPTKQEGFYLQVGDKSVRAQRASNTWCPILACSDPVACAKMAYILPDDVQTKTCDLTASMDFYMCGDQAPDDTPASSAPKSSAPAKSSQKASSPAYQPSTTLVPVASSAADNYNIKVAAVTPAPKNDDAAKGPKVKTKVVYVTEYANGKRHEHAHAHARRHQPFHA